jgi:subtilase family serine protease
MRVPPLQTTQRSDGSIRRVPTKGREVLMSFPRYAVRLLPLLLAASLLPAQQRIQEMQAIDAANVNQQVQFNVYLPIQNATQLQQLLVKLNDPNSPQYHKWLTPQQVKAQFGPSAASLATVTAALAARGVNVVGTHALGVKAAGTVGAVQKVLGVSLYNAVGPTGRPTLVAKGPFKLPPALVETGAQVAAFSSKIRNTVHSQRLGTYPIKPQVPNPIAASDVGPYWAVNLKEAYDYPSYQSLTGSGTNIAILMACGFSATDMTEYFGTEGLPVPTIVDETINGGTPFDPTNDACFESTLDIQQSGSMAPGATIIDYDIPSLSDEDVLDGYVAIIEDDVADVVSSSFGAPEGAYFPAYNGGTDYTEYLEIYDFIFMLGNTEGITFVASSGDSGGLPIPSVNYFLTPPQNAEMIPGVNNPASSPHVTGVGGTNLRTTYAAGNTDSTYVLENALYDLSAPMDPFGTGNTISNAVWGSGGGVSWYWFKPSYQHEAMTFSPMRTVPDISGHMGGCPLGVAVFPCPSDRSADFEIFDATLYGVIGTSASSPDIAGALALGVQLGGQRLGNANYLIYYLAWWQSQGVDQVFHQGIQGNNGAFTSPFDVPGYTKVLGNGTPFVRALIGGSWLPPAGAAGTSSNP